VLCAGNIVYDTVVRPVDELRWDQSTWVDSIEIHLGGNGAITSWTLGKLGVPVRLLSAIGKDSFGDQVLGLLGEVHVDTSGVVRMGAPTPCTVAVVHTNGARAILHRPGASSEAFRELPSLDSSFGHFHLANIYAVPALRTVGVKLLERARAAGMTTSSDTGWDFLGRWIEPLAPCLPYLDILFMNEEEARKLSGTDEPEAAVRFFLSRGVRVVVVKMGAAGCLLATGEGMLRLPGFAVTVADTTGAGDSFAGGFLAALYQGQKLEEAARFANAIGACSVTRLGGTAGLLGYEETLAWIKSAADRA